MDDIIYSNLKKTWKLLQENKNIDTIEIDGVQRSKFNNEGNLIYPTEKNIINFWKWFGNSKVIDEQGRPIVMYHGTNNPFTKVDIKKGAQQIFWMASNKHNIESGESGAANISSILKMYAKIVNPADWNLYDKLSLGEFKGRGLDGAILIDKDKTFDAFVFNSNQVKIIGN